MKRVLLTCLLVGLVAATAGAQIDDAGRWGVGVDYGLWKAIGGDRDYSTYEDFGAFHLRHGLSSHLSLDLGLKFGSLRPGAETPGDEVGWSTDATNPLHTRIWQPALSVVYHIVPTGHLRPWVSGGVGVTRWDVLQPDPGKVGWWPDGAEIEVYDEDGEKVAGHDVNITALLGVGVDYAFTDHLSLGVGVRTNVLFGQNRDNIGLGGASGFFDEDNPALNIDANNQIVEGTVGLRYMFGGISEPVAPPPPPPAPAPAKPVTPPPPPPPADRDHDGIIDANDKCPDQPEDKDGFEDTDGCPDPDNDGDGVLDAADKCPNTPKGVKVDETGCPVAQEIKAALVLEGVNFATNKADITPESAVILDRVADSLLAWPNVNVEIGGHTDSVGNDAANKKLSQARADSVRQYLIGKGVADDRMTAVGYGEEKPIGDNNTAEGKKANRRVEVTRTN